ncbi:MAG: biopolymer transporter ExbD [Phycisphaeraceae bacterium]|nr:biopolymer transporter ExbD [Phycisphaeraceae bacterium]
MADAAPANATPRPAFVGVPIPRRRRGLIARGGITLTMAPMIDVVFLLLMYFLLVGEFLPPEGLFELDLPKPLERQPPAPALSLPQPPVRLLVRSLGDAPGDYTIAMTGPLPREVASYDQLYHALDAARGRLLASDQAFIIAPAPDTRWEHTLGAFNAVLRAGFERIRFAPPSAPAPS